MVGHILLTGFLAYLALLAIFHLILLAALPISRALGATYEDWKQSEAANLYISIGAWLTLPIYALLNLPRRLARFWVAYRLTLRFLAKMEHAIDDAQEVDLTVLPAEEQRQFLHRMHTESDTRAVYMDALKRVREVEEAAK